MADDAVKQAQEAAAAAAEAAKVLQAQAEAAIKAAEEAAALAKAAAEQAAGEQAADVPAASRGRRSARGCSTRRQAATRPPDECPRAAASDGPLDAEHIDAIRAGYAFEGAALEMGALVNGDAMPDVQVRIPLAMTNRHGLVAGATGTGKTRTLQVLAEQLSANGVAVFAADIKGDLVGHRDARARATRSCSHAPRASGRQWTAGELPRPSSSRSAASGRACRSARRSRASARCC